MKAPDNLNDLYREPHRRFNPLTGEWVLVSPHRSERPWRGQTETAAATPALAYDPSCYLCPGNERAGGARNPNYKTTFVFTNDYAALQPGVHLEACVTRKDESGRGLMLAESEAGTCRVVCFSPRHDLTLARMTVEEIQSVVDVWVEQYAEIGSLPYVNYVQIFENRGEMMGCSNPHPHGQIWANQTIPNEPLKEQESQRTYAEKYQACLLCDYLQMETRAQTRVVLENEHFVTLVPFWAVWPFEVLVVCKRHIPNLLAFDQPLSASLADMFKALTTRYDNLFETSFPYSMGFHQAPTDGKPHPEWHLHAHFYPPLLRSATIRKFMVGYEMLASPQRDITPEAAAATLRNLPGLHYADRSVV
ncbi:MAG: UDP-glucose--hexose-1-phosphate uridylyltransferase [Terriglobales bacterium]